MSHDFVKHASPKHCTRCHGDADGFKCPQCGHRGAQYDPFHWQKCQGEGKMRVKCKTCQEAEDDCKC